MVACEWYDSLQYATSNHFSKYATINVMTEGYAANVPLFRDTPGSWKYSSFDVLGGRALRGGAARLGHVKRGGHGHSDQPLPEGHCDAHLLYSAQ